MASQFKRLTKKTKEASGKAILELSKKLEPTVAENWYERSAVACERSTKNLRIYFNEAY